MQVQMITVVFLMFTTIFAWGLSASMEDEGFKWKGLSGMFLIIVLFCGTVGVLPFALPLDQVEALASPLAIVAFLAYVVPLFAHRRQKHIAS